MSSDYILKFTDPDKAPFLIKAFSSNGPATPVSELPLHTLAVRADTSLVLIGKGVPNYGGDIIQGNILHLTENFANSTSPVYPIEGQLWYNNSAQYELSVYNGTDWRKLAISGGMSSTFDMTNQRIVNLADPSGALDAVNKQYADTTYLNASGDTVTGYLSISQDPTADQHAVHKKYVDDAIDTVASSGSSTAYTDAQVALRVAKAGDTMTGTLVLDNANIDVQTGNLAITNGSILFLGASAGIDMGTSKISTLAEPTAASDAATKNYVDTTTTNVSISSGNYDQSTGVLTLQTGNGGTIAMTGEMAPLLHTHRAIDLLYGVLETISLQSNVLHYYANQAIAVPDQIGFIQAFGQLDSAVNNLMTRTDRVVVPGNSSTTITLPFNYPVEMHKLSVYKNGIKLLKNDRATARMAFPAGTNLLSDTGLTNQAYKFNVTVDGVLHTDVTVDLTNETAPIPHYVLLRHLNNALEPAPTISVSFTTPLVDGTEPTGLVSTDLYQAVIAVDGIEREITLQGGSATTMSQLASFISVILGSPVTVSGGKLVIQAPTNGALGTISITDVAGPSPAPLFGSLNNFSAIDASVAGTTTAVVQYHRNEILVMSPTDGTGSEVTLAAPATGTNLLTSLTGVSVSNQTISQDYDYSEPTVPLNFVNTVNFTATTLPADNYEFIVEPHLPEITPGGVYKYAVN